MTLGFAAATVLVGSFAFVPILALRIWLAVAEFILMRRHAPRAGRAGRL